MMSHLVIPIPTEDELIHGFLGRIAHLNALPSLAAVLKKLRDHFSEPTDKTSTPALVFLARAIGLSEEDNLAEQHTMSALYNTVTRLDGLRTDWTPAETALRKFGSLNSKVYALPPKSCPLCVERDYQQHGISIWYRRHQLPGLKYCSQHMVPLQQHPDCDAYFRPPARGSIASSVATDNPVVQRYIAICEYFLADATSLRMRDLRQRLMEHVCVYNHSLFVGSSGDTPLLPGSWSFIRLRHLTAWTRTHLTEEAVDVLQAASGFDATSYAAALSLVLDDADEAIQFHRRPQPASSRYQEGTGHYDFWSAQRNALLTHSEELARSIQEASPGPFELMLATAGTAIPSPHRSTIDLDHPRAALQLQGEETPYAH